MFAESSYPVESRDAFCAFFPPPPQERSRRDFFPSPPSLVECLPTIESHFSSMRCCESDCRTRSDCETIPLIRCCADPFSSPVRPSPLHALALPSCALEWERHVFGCPLIVFIPFTKRGFRRALFFPLPIRTPLSASGSCDSDRGAKRRIELDPIASLSGCYSSTSLFLSSLRETTRAMRVQRPLVLECLFFAK